MVPDDQPPKAASAAESSGRIDVPARDAASGSSTPVRPPDIIYHLWFEQFKQINGLAVAATAGALILLQMGFVEVTAVSGGSILAMAASVLVAMHGQDTLIEEAVAGRLPGVGVRRARGAAATLLAAGAGAFISYGYFS